MDEHRCPDCQRTLDANYNRTRCNTCRQKDLCACGRSKQKKATICETCRRASESGAANGNWRGGKTRHHAGYLMVLLPGHPRAKTGGKYVFEHILVAEEMLGRPLYPNETVHHRNGVRDDNRPENLEIWTKPQPAGIRASDALAWAREILERYEGPGVTRTALTEPRPVTPT
jgi:hypothetical protein